MRITQMTPITPRGGSSVRSLPIHRIALRNAASELKSRDIQSNCSPMPAQSHCRSEAKRGEDQAEPEARAG